MTKEIDKREILESRPWSFSKVNSYEHCPRMFKFTYLDKKKRENNSFAEFGTFCHEILERYYKGDLEFFELSQVYEDEYDDAVTLEFPPNKYVDLSETYYEQGKRYFDNFEGSKDKTKIIGVEQKIDCDIWGHKLIGYIDLVVQQEDKLIIIDHKSKKSFTKKEREEYLRQLYLYAEAVKDLYGKYPETLIFNMFRAQDMVVEKFDVTKCEAAKRWFCETIDKIYDDSKYKVNRNQFFCDYICSVRKFCYVSGAYEKVVVDCS